MGDGTLNVAAGRRTLTIIAAFAVAVALAFCLRAAPADAAPAKCAGSFRVLHNDHIGALAVPAGQYQLTVRNSAALSCSRASDLFTRFLEDYDGVLPGGWIITGPGAQFRRGATSAIGFSITRNAGGGGGNTPGGGGKHPQNGTFCPGTFRVLNRDHIGRLQLAAGPYYVILLQAKGLTCKQASANFTRFLSDVAGVLPAPWTLSPQTARFRRGPHGPGFRVKPATR